ncbi:hypothetical protein [Chlorobaculum limnaeum]|nr:hypothetical protein [Chlorobaculum limnaeum]
MAIFNDKDEDNSKSLDEAISKIPRVEELRYKPKVYNEEVGEKIVKML